MMKDIYLKKKLASSWFSLLHQIICKEFQKIELDFASKTKQKAKYLKIKNWKKSELKNEGGGTFAIIKNGLVFDSLGINFSEVSGKFNKKFRSQVLGASKNPKYLEIDVEGPNLGEDIVAVGYPLGNFTGEGVKITRGVVSSLSGPGNNYSEFQHDASVGPGSSGGPVINKSGQVVGVVYGGLDKLRLLKELELQIVDCWQAGSGEDVGGKAATAFPLKPSILYE